MKLLEPIEIKGMKLPNRIAFPPFMTWPRGEDGNVNDLTIRWYEARAKGGAGLIMAGGISSDAAVTRDGMERIRRLVEVIHSYGVKIAIQGGVWPLRGRGIAGPMGGRGPSPPPYPDERHPTDEMFWLTGMRDRTPVTEVTVEEIERAIVSQGEAAARAKEAGFDCVEIHCAHGGATPNCSFISPYYNRRTDEYGGSWENRLRLPVESLKKMREAVGEDYPLFARISADQFVGKGGITIQDTTQIIVPALEKAGVDCIDVSQGDMVRANQGIQPSLYYPRGCFIHLAAAVKKVSKVPVIGVGRILDLEMAERFLQEGKADIIYMGGQLTADPETPKKYFEGRPEDIRKCIGCRHGTGACGRPCPINYDIQDQPIPFSAAEKPKNVLVIGGGVGGMEAARIATIRGHKVTLMEKHSELGGMVAALALTKLTAEFRNIVDYLATQMGKLKVDVRVCKEATLADVEELKPDVVILAAGSSMVIPEVAKGKPGVMNHIEACQRQREIGQKVVIWGLVAAELAISLAEEGKDVIMMGRGGEETLARDYPMPRKFWMLRKLTDVSLPRETPEAKKLDNLEILYYVDVEEITADGIRIVNRDGARRILPYDTLIISRERASNDSLFEELQGKAPVVYKIGDCSQVGDIKEAIWGANEVARKI